MSPKFEISVTLTVLAVLLAVVLFGTVVIVQSKIDPAPVDVISSASSVPPTPAIEHPGQKIFKTNCQPCHRVHQKLVGPALAGVLDRRDSLWVIKFIRNSSQLIASGDPVAVALFEEYNKTQMTSFTSFSDEDLRNLLEYLRLETKRGQTLPAVPRVEV
jgi:mono/diheme cytochrome c family protein